MRGDGVCLSGHRLRGGEVADVTRGKKSETALIQEGVKLAMDEVNRQSHAWFQKSTQSLESKLLDGVWDDIKQLHDSLGKRKGKR